MEYSLEFSQRLIESAESIEESDEAGRAILYLSMLSCEISLKATLEVAGFTVNELKAKGHHVDVLLNDLANCQFKDSGEVSSGIRAKVVIPDTGNGTVGALLTAQASECSVYPNGIRYGELVEHFPPMVMLTCAKVLHQWCNQNVENLVRHGNH
ncbi:MAG: hypothetical protein COA71_01805 [SAR86 cluster bacterium]|uniref:HEPN domain-containing protein n=1 Tax=SAR86 cluster bacterium TaxID=2030880 RepID=A0A2A5CIM2_9GAMM|nr:MAG: hypothetical protein COA71_01805 [SAR86 cluster bacterium]